MSGIDVTVFDTWAATLGQGLQVIKAAMLAEKVFLYGNQIN